MTARGNAVFGSVHNVLRRFPLQKKGWSGLSTQPSSWTKSPLLRRFVDSDRDGVPDHLDCAPKNWKRQGDNVSGHKMEVRCTGYIPAGGSAPAYACAGSRPAVWYKPVSHPTSGVSHSYCPACAARQRVEFAKEREMRRGT